MNHKQYMAEALALAEKGIGSVSPNPAVGALLVKDGRIIGRGFHRGPGCRHGEIEAIENASEPVEGAVLYTTLEPCCSVYEGKRQPPCTERIISEGIGEVVIASRDPNPKVQGGGIARLTEAGIAVTEGILHVEEEILNEVFRINQEKQRPFVHLKMAQTLDGRIATAKGDSKWITDSKAREDVHSFRALYDAVLIGAGTAEADDPLLTTRLDGISHNNKRIVLNRYLNLNPDLKLFRNQEENQTWIITARGQNPELQKVYTDKGVRLLEVELNSRGEFDLKHILSTLYSEGICSLFIEGGASVYTSFLKERLFDRLSVYIAPKISGKGIEAVGDLNTALIADSLTFDRTAIELINDQVVVHGWRC